MEVRFSQLEKEVVDIYHNVDLLMVALRNKLGIFREDGGLDANEKSQWETEDQGETKNHLKK